MTSLREMEFDLVIETARRLSDFGLDKPLAEVIRSMKNEDAAREWVAIGREMLSPDSELAKAMAVAALEAKRDYLDRNPFALPVPEILARFRKANEEEGWGFGEEVFARLLETAPQELPKGRDTFLTLRIRWGEGREGVIQTFERHVARILSVFGDNFCRWESLLSGAHIFNGRLVERLKLHAGDDTHHATVEWTVVDLSANRERDSITAVRGPSSIADEGLALAWFYPERVRATDYDKLPAWFCAGYELCVPGYDGGSWMNVPLVLWGRDPHDRKIKLSASRYNDHCRSFSVPAAVECQH